MLINKLKQKFLEKSGTYQYYKNENNLLSKKLNNDINDLKNQIKLYNSKIKDLEEKNRYYEDIIQTNHIFLNTLFVDYKLTPQGILKNMQMLCQELLDFVVNICNKHDINYWLVGGNLMGAIRNEGYIPWDDDMDIGMMRKDFHTFNDIISDEVKNYNLEKYIKVNIYPIIRKNFVQAFTILNCITPDNDIIATIDIFPYDFAKDKNITLDEFCEFRNEFFVRLSSKDNINDIVNDYYKKFNLDFDDGKYVIPNPTFLRFAERYKKDLCFWDKNKIFPLTYINFNGKFYNCPKDSNYFLALEYGNYREIPYILKDLHFNVDNLRDVDNLDKYYSEFFNVINECNNNFKL